MHGEAPPPTSILLIGGAKAVRNGQEQSIGFVYRERHIDTPIRYDCLHVPRGFHTITAITQGRNRAMERSRWMVAVLALCLFLAGYAAGQAPWDLEQLSAAPAVHEAPGFEAEGVRALFYEGQPYKGNPTRVFAWYGAPAAPAGAKVPAMVLVHGGGGTAFDVWVRLWVSRGYAAIAMDTCGCVPKGTYGHWERHEFGGPAGWGDFEHVDEPTTDQWTYHAIADVILAHSLIRSFPEVDAARVGITGISWGGYLTCITAGVDSRLKFAAPVYGCGFLGENSAWLKNFAEMGADKAGRWLGNWDPSQYLPLAKMPMLWVTGTNDFAYPMDSLRKSYRLPAGTRQLCIRPRMPHGHGGAGENPEEIRAFADAQFNGGKPLAVITGQGCEANTAWVTYDAQTPIARAELNYTCDTGVWQERNWEAIPATIDPDAKKAAAAIPEKACVYYFNLVDERDLVTSSEHAEREP